jgi:hypothetical protein
MHKIGRQRRAVEEPPALVSFGLAQVRSLLSIGRRRWFLNGWSPRRKLFQMDLIPPAEPIDRHAHDDSVGLSQRYVVAIAGDKGRFRLKTAARINPNARRGARPLRC